MGTLSITRTSQYTNSHRRCSILVDGIHAADVSDGETARIQVDDGIHEVVAKLDWCRSKPLEVEVEPGGQVRLRTGCDVRGWKVCLALLYVLVPGWYLYVDSADPGEDEGSERM
jgi:hypothetical protein